uniref:NADH dehydrogenase subunit 6 n=1 Tax=Amblyomma tonelliae TaxID=1408822 RepID=UPI0023F4B3CE|nr:NADH dehydrogenase subunit 6 [Amblyomma tonelliae]WEF75025.1 NADH dehydrogenase subunit 6 [Amblyomma tonelliae]
MKFLLTISLILIVMSHPMTMLIAVIFLTLFISMIFYKISENSILPLIVILMILGGMMIIFMYIISLCPNKKMSFNMKFLIFSLMIVMFNMDLIFIKVLNQDLMKIYFFSYINSLLFLMLYLLITLAVILKNLNWISSPMKSW